MSRSLSHPLTIERALMLLDDDTSERRSEIQSSIAESLHSMANASGKPPKSLPRAITIIAQTYDPTTARPLALTLIRLVTDPRLALNDNTSCRHHIVKLIQEGAPDLVKAVWKEKRMHHEKLDALTKIHTDTRDRLSCLRDPFPNLIHLANLRQRIMQNIRNKVVRQYLYNFDYDEIMNRVDSLLNQVEDLTQMKGPNLQNGLTDCVTSTDDAIKHYKDNPAFFIPEFILPFFSNVKQEVLAYQNKMAGEFACEIIRMSPIDVAEKKYPLHLVGHQINLPVTLNNCGPGAAQNARAVCVAGKGHVKQDEIPLGVIEPGLFVFDVEIMVTENTDQIDLEFEIKWNVIGRPDDESISFAVSILGQRSDIDWVSLSSLHPYSLNVVEAEDFRGRQDQIRKILKWLDPNSMTNCHIFGQKRVGKSSLAKKIESELRHRSSNNCYVTFVEWGDIVHATGRETLSALGTALEDFFMSNCHVQLDWDPQDYSSSLSPLIRLVEKIRRDSPSSRFVVILDEFDEIDEELYRSGPLARTFFLNLRTLSSKKNVAFVLVGAERMPYIMTSQGEKLNKFEPVELDSFDLETEMGDYTALVSDPVSDSIKFHDSAIRKLYDLTVGHPYFTKMLCEEIFDYSVECSDAEVSASEVDVAARRVVRRLQINNVAHYWRDGVRGNEEEQEIGATKRARLLLLWVRNSHANRAETIESLEEYARSGSLDPSEVRPLINEFCKRGVFVEKERTYHPKIELFSSWLKQHGLAKLIDDPLADELESKRREIEAKAYVSSEEIVGLVDQWDVYGPRKVTEDRVRMWLGQVPSVIERRLLFKLLMHVRFVSYEQAQERFASVHSLIRKQLPVRVQRKRIQRRDDIYVSYVDGAGKSGAECARMYANVNEIVLTNVISPEEIHDRLRDVDGEAKAGLVVVDDFIGTGSTLESGLQKMQEIFQQADVGSRHPLLVVALCGTREGEKRVSEYIDRTMPEANLRVCEVLAPEHYAFHDESNIWESEVEMDSARTLVANLGERVQRSSPLGYKNHGLLLTFWRNCPNNSLPILHGRGKRSSPWEPLFQRIR